MAVENNLQKQLKRSHQVELQDSTATYLLQVTELYEEGQSMPLDYARPAIEEVILSQRQVSFLQEERKITFRLLRQMLIFPVFLKILIIHLSERIQLKL